MVYHWWYANHLSVVHVLLSAKNMAVAVPDSLLTWRKQGTRVWAVNAARSAKHFPTDFFLPCIKTAAAAAFLPKGRLGAPCGSRREQSRSSARGRGEASSRSAWHSADALTPGNHSVTISPPSPPQALPFSELVSLDTGAIRPSCTPSEGSRGGPDPFPSITLAAAACPEAAEPSRLPGAGASGAQCGHPWAHAAHTHCRCHAWPAPSNSKLGNPCTTVKLKKQLRVSECEWDALIRVIWWLWQIYFFLLLYKNAPLFACFIHLLFLTDTFSSAASFHLSNDLVGCIYLNTWKLFISTDHQSWVPAQINVSSELRDVGSNSQCTSEPACSKASGSAHKPSPTVHRGLETPVAEQLNAGRQQI